MFLPYLDASGIIGSAVEEAMDLYRRGKDKRAFEVLYSTVKRLNVPREKHEDKKRLIDELWLAVRDCDEEDALS